jgi:radical SAM/Cys-rich protein
MVDRFLGNGTGVTSRCNLSILLEPGYFDTAQWYAEREVHLVCSLPCYTESNVDAQRGNGVFDKSIEALRLLNGLGYGDDEKRVLDLVYNPGDAFLPPAQEQLEADYKRHLLDEFGIVFNKLLTITNLPISRFAHYLDRTGQRQDYLQLLVDNFNARTVSALMCRHLVSVDWQGRIYDCDFNQMLGLPYRGSKERYLWDLQPEDVFDKPIAVGAHCFGCTAGAGSSCGGALD